MSQTTHNTYLSVSTFHLVATDRKHLWQACQNVFKKSGDGGGFFPRLRRFWENVQLFILRLRFFFFFEVEISSRTLHLLFMLGSFHSSSAS